MEILKIAVAIGLGMILENPAKRQRLMSGLDKVGKMTIDTIKSTIDTVNKTQGVSSEPQETPPSESEYR